MIHELKTDTTYFDEVITGLKKFDVRLNDRGYQAADILHLREWRARECSYTGRYCYALVVYIASPEFALREGYVVMSIVLVGEPKEVDETYEAAKADQPVGCDE